MRPRSLRKILEGPFSSPLSSIMVTEHLEEISVPLFVSLHQIVLSFIRSGDAGLLIFIGSSICFILSFALLLLFSRYSTFGTASSKDCSGASVWGFDLYLYTLWLLICRAAITSEQTLHCYSVCRVFAPDRMTRVPPQLLVQTSDPV